MDDDQLEVHDAEAGHVPEMHDEAEDEPRSGISFVKILAILIVVAGMAVAGWMLTRPRAVAFTTPYQAVLLINGGLFFGHLEGYGTSNPVLTEVYYVQSTVDPETKKQNNILLRRGKEWHGPDRMYINPQQIVIVEPVSPDSRVGELIANSKLR